MALPNDIKGVLLSEEEIHKRVAELAADINRDYAQSQNLMLVGVLKGSFIFLADLARQITIPHTVDFVALSSYGQKGAESGGIVRMIMDTRLPMYNADVVIVEDILDTGYTLAYLVRTFLARDPASLKTCALLHKPSRQRVHMNLDYIGFQIPDAWVVGYGLDYKDRYRTLPYIAELKPEVYQ